MDENDQHLLNNLLPNLGNMPVLCGKLALDNTVVNAGGFVDSLSDQVFALAKQLADDVLIQIRNGRPQSEKTGECPSLEDENLAIVKLLVISGMIDRIEGLMHDGAELRPVGSPEWPDKGTIDQGVHEQLVAAQRDILSKYPHLRPVVHLQKDISRQIANTLEDEAVVIASISPLAEVTFTPTPELSHVSIPHVTAILRKKLESLAVSADIMFCGEVARDIAEAYRSLIPSCLPIYDHLKVGRMVPNAVNGFRLVEMLNFGRALYYQDSEQLLAYMTSSHRKPESEIDGIGHMEPVKASIETFLDSIKVLLAECTVFLSKPYVEKRGWLTRQSPAWSTESLALNNRVMSMIALKDSSLIYDSIPGIPESQFRADLKTNRIPALEQFYEDWKIVLKLVEDVERFESFPEPDTVLLSLVTQLRCEAILSHCKPGNKSGGDTSPAWDPATEIRDGWD